jgi:hypothetical protein
MKLVSVRSANNMGLASIIQGVLEQAGVESVLSGSGAEDAFPVGTIDNLRVLVAEDDVERALAVLDEYETAQGPEEDDE